MNKLELINTMRNECQISKKEAATIVDLFFNKMANALAKGDRVEIRGLMWYIWQIPKDERHISCKLIVPREYILQ